MLTKSKDEMKTLRDRANQYTLRNDRDGYNAFWSDDELVDLYLEPGRLDNFRLVAHLAADWAGRCIDLGCGCGTMLRLLLEADRTGRKSIVGVDYTAASVERCRRVLPNGAFFEADIASLSFDDASYDYAFSMQTMEHLDQPKTSFDEMMRILVPGGRAVVTIPNGAVDHWEGHRNFWTIESFTGMTGQVAERAELFNNDRNILLIFNKAI